jgi:hypothetical protein
MCVCPEGEARADTSAVDLGPEDVTSPEKRAAVLREVAAGTKVCIKLTILDQVEAIPCKPFRPFFSLNSQRPQPSLPT